MAQKITIEPPNPAHRRSEKGKMEHYLATFGTLPQDRQIGNMNHFLQTFGLFQIRPHNRTSHIYNYTRNIQRNRLLTNLLINSA